MFIPTLCCATSSFCQVESEQADKARVFQIFSFYAVAGTYIVDAIIVLAALMLGYVAFTAPAQLAISHLPLSAKVTLIAGGAILLISDTIFLIFRLGKEDEVGSQEGVTQRNSLQNPLGSLPFISDSHKIKVLEERVIPDAQEAIRKAQEIVNSSGEDAEIAATQKKLEELLKEAQEQLTILKAKVLPSQ